MNYFPKLLKDYFKKNLGLYMLVSFIFIIGVVTGSISVNLMPENQMKDILSFINSFLANVNNVSVESSEIFVVSLSNNLKTSLLLGVLGFTVIGFPLILALIFLRGYILGFTVGFFIGGLGARGLLLSILSILPQNMIIIPSIISIAVAGTIFSATVLKNRKVLYAEGYSHLIISYVLYNLMFSVLLVFSSLIEGYISPTFIKLLTHYI